jgi:polysaccharide export outer membrane protein
MKIFFTILLLFIWIPAAGQIQIPPQRTILPNPQTQDDFITNRPSNTPTSTPGQDYRIGTDDLVEVTVFEIPELNATTRVSAGGVVSMPLIGPVTAAGLTPQEVARTIENALKKNYINDPHVTVFVREYASQPVSVIGAVKVPGIYQIKGQKRLLDMLAMAQGLDQTTVGSSIQVIRRKTDGSEDTDTILVGTEDLFQNGRTELNVVIQAGDVINVLQSGSIFVIGEVLRPGEFVLRQGKPVTAVQAVALASGFNKEAKKKDCMIIRLHRDGTKEEIPVDIEKILNGSNGDVALLTNDILFVPATKVRTGINRALETTIATLAARIVYRF